MRNTRAFTLIELLVVISIISLLISILLPALSSARESGRMAQCLANQRTLGLGIIGYVTSEGDLPIGNQRGAALKWGHTWDAKILPYIYDQSWDTWAAKGGLSYNIHIANQPKAFLCPSDGLNRISLPAVAKRSYAGNRGEQVSNQPVTGVFWDTPPAVGNYLRYDEIDDATGTVMLGEYYIQLIQGIYNNTQVMGVNEQVAAGYPLFLVRASGTYSVQNTFPWAHNEQSTFLYADGHAKAFNNTIELSDFTHIKD